MVLLPEPCYPVFADGAALRGAELHYMPLKEENDYLIDLDAIPEELARRAKLMIVPPIPITPPAPLRRSGSMTSSLPLQRNTTSL